MELADEVRAVLREELKLADLKPEQLRAETPLFGPDGLGLDSIDALELVVILKRRFKVDIPDRAAGERAFQSIGSLVEFVRGARKTG
jgi:acyl carrier protein